MSRAVIEPVEARRLLAADLTHALAGALPDSLPPGLTQKVTVRVANVGDTVAKGAASVALFASADPTLSGDDARLGDTVRSLKLKPGRTANVRIAVPPPTALATGAYTIFAAVHTGTSAVVDANPANDVVMATRTVSVAQPSIDLTGQFAKLPGAPLEAFAGGRSSSATVRVFNTGNTIAQGHLTVSVYLSSDTLLDASDAPLGTSPLKSATIKPGGKKDVKVTLQAPSADTAAGRYSLIAVVDPTDVIGEASESNNTAVSATQVPVVKTRPPDYDDHRHHYDHEYYWTDDIYFDTVYYYDDGGWYYTDEPVVYDDGGYYDAEFYEGDDYDSSPPPPMYEPPPQWDDWSEPEPYTPPPSYDPPADSWNDYGGGGGDTVSDPWNDYAGGDDPWLGDDW